MQNTLSPVKQAVVAALFVVAVLAGLVSTASPASAMRVEPGGDSVQRECRRLQDQVIAKEKELGNPKTTPARKEQLRNEISTLKSDWETLGCNNSWGDIRVYQVKRTKTTTIGPTKAVK